MSLWRATLRADSPEWRNWQTQQTQNLPKLCFVWVRLPPPGPFLSVFSGEMRATFLARAAQQFFLNSAQIFD
jgi:hypothetical protein